MTPARLVRSIDRSSLALASFTRAAMRANIPSAHDVHVQPYDLPCSGGACLVPLHCDRGKRNLFFCLGNHSLFYLRHAHHPSSSTWSSSTMHERSQVGSADWVLATALAVSSNVSTQGLRRLESSRDQLPSALCKVIGPARPVILLHPV